MVTIEEAAQMAMALPEVTDGQRYGNRTWDVAGTTFAWVREALVDGWLACAPADLADRHFKRR